ncbi:MAG TPA: beta-ketoacyl synthase N-terminal-like domain-containing protein, partial [Thermoanaerobaculia bacterium]
MSVVAGLASIAIIGMSGRFPGAPDLATYWRNLRDGVESISFFSPGELAASGVPAELIADPAYVPARGILDDPEGFDAALFGFAPGEAERMDPQHRVFLECAWEALDDAGYDPARIAGPVGVFAGASLNAFALSRLHAALSAPGESLLAAIANDRDFLPTRVSHKLNLRGPSLSVGTACSTSLVALHLACQSLLSGECDVALAGAVRIATPQKSGFLHRPGDIVAPDGRCRAFDARAEGTVGGNGAGVVVLKRLADARADGDAIRAIVRGSAVNNDGADKIGYTAPGIAGQAAVIREALAVAGVSPDDIGYVEAHGTGTALGDPVEIAALTQAFRHGHGSDNNTTRTGFCRLGSVKTNIGHLDTAAGMAGLIKTVLALENGQIPPSLHFETPNPGIDFAASPFTVNAALSPWPRGAAPRRAGVSSFGLGGTNVHVILEEAPPAQSSPSPSGDHLLVLSARSAAALETATDRLADHLRRHSESVSDIAYTLQTGRAELEHRRMVVCPAGSTATDTAAILTGRDPERVVTRRAERRDRP